MSVFTIYHTVIMGERVSEGILEQSVNINGIVNEIRTGIPAGRSEQEFEEEVRAIVKRHPGWQVETHLSERLSGLYALQPVSYTHLMDIENQEGTLLCQIEMTMRIREE